MKTRTFEKEIFIQADAATVINVIADYYPTPKNSSAYHQSGTRQIRTAGHKTLLHYRQPEVGTVQIQEEISSDIIFVTEDTVYTEAYQAPGTSVTNLTKITQQGTGVLLHETITMRAPDMLYEYAFQGQSSHMQRCLSASRHLLNCNGKYNWEDL
jgi:hypothetical protein